MIASALADVKVELSKGNLSDCVCDKNKVLTNVRERNKIQTVKDIKAVKRRVGEEIRRRESRQVGRDMEGFFEHGLGALHRLRIMISGRCGQAATGVPVIVPDYR